MRKKISLIFLCVSLIVFVSACGKSDNSKNEYIEIEGNSYKLQIPADFTESETDIENAKIWDSPDIANTEFQVVAYDAGNSDYTDDTLPQTFDEYNESNEISEGEAREEVYFDYSDENGLEQSAMIMKSIYSEGSPVYELQMLINDDFKENDSVVQYYAQKVIVDQSDRSKAVKLVVYSNDNGDIDLMKQILNSFEWK